VNYWNEEPSYQQYQYSLMGQNFPFTKAPDTLESLVQQIVSHTRGRLCFYLLHIIFQYCEPSASVYQYTILSAFHYGNKIALYRAWEDLNIIPEDLIIPDFWGEERDFIKTTEEDPLVSVLQFPDFYIEVRSSFLQEAPKLEDKQLFRIPFPTKQLCEELQYLIKPDN
jgi:hypothetical protein